MSSDVFGCISTAFIELCFPDPASSKTSDSTEKSKASCVSHCKLYLKLLLGLNSFRSCLFGFLFPLKSMGQLNGLAMIV